MQLASRFNHRTTGTRASQPLTDEQIRRVAPSVFATGKHESRSERYTYVPTIQVLDGLRREGFQPFNVVQARARDESRREFTRHMLRLRRANDIGAEGEVPEVVLLNSHDGTSSYQMLAGMIRFACANGLIFGSGVDEIRVPHSGDIVGRVIEGAFTVVDEFDRVRASAESMKAITLSKDEQLAFAGAALVARYGEQPAYPVLAEQVNFARRSADEGDDLWRTFNRAQEALVRGGLHGRTAKGRRQRTREIRGIGQNVQLNRALWTLAEAMKLHKQ